MYLSLVSDFKSYLSLSRPNVKDRLSGGIVSLRLKRVISFLYSFVSMLYYLFLHIFSSSNHHYQKYVIDPWGEIIGVRAASERETEEKHEEI